MDEGLVSQKAAAKEARKAAKQKKAEKLREEALASWQKKKEKYFEYVARQEEKEKAAVEAEEAKKKAEYEASFWGQLFKEKQENPESNHGMDFQKQCPVEKDVAELPPHKGGGWSWWGGASAASPGDGQASDVQETMSVQVSLSSSSKDGKLLVEQQQAKSSNWFERFFHSAVESEASSPKPDGDGQGKEPTSIKKSGYIGNYRALRKDKTRFGSQDGYKEKIGPTIEENHAVEFGNSSGSSSRPKESSAQPDKTNGHEDFSWFFFQGWWMKNNEGAGASPPQSKLTSPYSSQDRAEASSPSSALLSGGVTVKKKKKKTKKKNDSSDSCSSSSGESSSSEEVVSEPKRNARQRQMTLTGLIEPSGLAGLIAGPGLRTARPGTKKDDSAARKDDSDVSDEDDVTASQIAAKAAEDGSNPFINSAQRKSVRASTFTPTGNPFVDIQARQASTTRSEAASTSSSVTAQISKKDKSKFASAPPRYTLSSSSEDEKDACRQQQTEVPSSPTKPGSDASTAPASDSNTPRGIKSWFGEQQSATASAPQPPKRDKRIAERKNSITGLTSQSFMDMLSGAPGLRNSRAGGGTIPPRTKSVPQSDSDD